MQHVREAPQVGFVSGRGIGRVQTNQVDTHCLAVLKQGAGNFWRGATKLGDRALRPQVMFDGSPEQRGVSPLGHDTRHALAGFRVDCGRWLQMFQHVGDECRVAVDFRADLQERRLAVAPGQYDDVGLGAEAGHQYRLPGQLLVTEDQARFLGKRRTQEMVKNQISHVCLESASMSVPPGRSEGTERPLGGQRTK